VLELLEAGVPVEEIKRNLQAIRHYRE